MEYVVLGKTVAKDRVTGFIGTITAECTYLGGLKTYRIEQLKGDGTIHTCWVDGERLTNENP